jgi:hypothetical protein
MSDRETAEAIVRYCREQKSTIAQRDLIETAFRAIRQNAVDAIRAACGHKARSKPRPCAQCDWPIAAVKALMGAPNVR